nr:o-methyltransferase gsfc [Quercus suber]
MEIGAMRALMKLGVIQALPYHGYISLSKLASNTAVSEALLVGTKFIHQTESGKYGHTRFSRGYLEDAGAWCDMALTSMLRYPNYLDAHRGEPIVEPNGTHNAWTWTHGMEGKTTFDVVATRPALMEQFARAMRMKGQARPTLSGFPFDQLVIGDGDRMAIVDVAFPRLDPARIVLQDRFEVISIAKDSAELPAAMVKMAHDFMEPQPIKHARAYFMRFIMHDYVDNVCIKILSHIRDAMAPDSKVLIADMIIPDRLDEQSLPSGLYDMLLMHVGGKERTEAGFDKLLEAAGLKRLNIWMTPGTPQGIIEAGLA